MIETSQLQTLVTVAKSKSFSKAAEELNVTQSAISQSIKNLESKLEVKLFKRAGKKVVLTTEGEKLYNLADDFLHDLDDTLDEIRHDKESMSGKIRFGTLTGIGKSWLAPELLEIANEFPEISIQMTLGFQEDLVRDFLNYRLDILILPEHSLPAQGDRLLLSEEKATLVYPKKASFSINEKISLEELAALPTILFEHNDPLYMNFCRKKFGRIPKKVNGRFTVNSHGNMLHAVEMGMGLAIVPNHVLIRSYYRDRVKTLGPNFEVTNEKFFMVCHKGATELQRIQFVLERLRSSKNPLNMSL
jgi:DNA-binding transcriptional LysR family regulator